MLLLTILRPFPVCDAGKPTAEEAEMAWKVTISPHWRGLPDVEIEDDRLAITDPSSCDLAPATYVL